MLFLARLFDVIHIETCSFYFTFFIKTKQALERKGIQVDFFYKLQKNISETQKLYNFFQDIINFYSNHLFCFFSFE